MATYTIEKITQKSAYGVDNVAYKVSRDEDGLKMGVFVWHSNALRWIEDRARKDKANANARAKRQAMKDLGMKRVRGANGGTYYE